MSGLLSIVPFPAAVSTWGSPTSTSPPTSGSGSTSFSTVTAGGQEIVILTLSKEPVPPPRSEGDKVAVGGQTIDFDGKKLVFAK
jgi:hypothetical protein